MLSASSRMTSLVPEPKRERRLAKLEICSRTTSMPRASDALSCGAGLRVSKCGAARLAHARRGPTSSVMALMFLPYSCFATARMVDVLPVPGGP